MSYPWRLTLLIGAITSVFAILPRGLAIAAGPAGMMSTLVFLFSTLLFLGSIVGAVYVGYMLTDTVSNRVIR